MINSSHFKINKYNIRYFLDLILIFSIVIYSFFDPFSGIFNLSFLKRYFLLNIVFCWSLWSFITLIDLRIKIFRPSFTMIAFILLTPIYLLVWDDYREINLALSPMIGYMAYRRSDLFIRFLKIILIIQFLCLTYEYLTGTYLYVKMETGGILNEKKENDFSEQVKKAYVNIGFRAKGIFNGTLLSAALIIDSCLILRGELSWLVLLIFMSVATNGRLALAISFMAIVIHFIKRKWITLRLSLKPLLAVMAITLVALAIISLLSASALTNLANILNLRSTANLGRIVAMLIGIREFIRYDALSMLLGRSGYIYTVHAQGAESEIISHLLNIGIIGTACYLFLPTMILYHSARLKKYDLFLSMTLMLGALAISRHTAGPMRGLLYWYFVFISWDELKRNGAERAGKPLKPQAVSSDVDHPRPDDTSDPDHAQRTIQPWPA